MGVSFASYEIARSGLFVNERGLTVTGHNISNVNTAGYVRQQAMITTGQYQSEVSRTGIYQLGLGADIQQIRQIRHSFLDNIYRQESTTFGYWEARNKTYQDVQAILGEPMGAGLQSVMNQFWDSWQELSKAPDSLTVRALVRQRGEAFIHHVNHLGSQLDKLQEDLNSEIQVRINEINNLTQGIAKLNVEILKTEVSGDSANDYRDQRNTYIDRLSKLVNAEINEMQDGQIAVTLGGYFLVTKGVSTNLYAEENQTGSKFLVPKLEGTKIEVPIKSGTLKGLMEARGEVNGAVGSLQNGTPNEKVDVVFAVDLSNTSPAYLTNITSNITNYVNQLQKNGVDYNLKLIAFGDNASSCSNCTDAADLLAQINAANLSGTYSLDSGNNFGGTNGVIQRLVEADAASQFRQDAVRQTIVFSAESLGGNTGTDITDVSGYINNLNGIKMHVSVATNSSFFSQGESAAELGWKSITDGTGGTLHDISDSNLMTSAAKGSIQVVNQEMSTISQTNNILADLRKRLNAMINVMIREVNSIHSSGKTLTGLPGGNFFATLNDDLPFEMGNIKLDNSLSSSAGLNNVVASASGGNGDNTIALEIANLRHKSLLGTIGETISIDDFYRGVILQVGNEANDAARISENQSKLVQSADDYRTSITGVSMDEEMSNMMKFKFAYNAASRHLNVIDQMMDTIISRMGLAGR